MTTDTWLSPGWAALALAAGQSILGLWAYARFEPKKTSDMLAKEKGTRKEEFAECWNASILENAQKRHEEIAAVAGALFVLRTTHHDAMSTLDATMQRIRIEQSTQGLEIGYLKESLSSVSRGMEKMNNTLSEINTQVGTMSGIWQAHVQEHGGLSMTKHGGS